MRNTDREFNRLMEAGRNPKTWGDTFERYSRAAVKGGAVGLAGGLAARTKVTQPNRLMSFLAKSPVQSPISGSHTIHTDVGPSTVVGMGMGLAHEGVKDLRKYLKKRSKKK